MIAVDFSEEITCPQLDTEVSAYSIARSADCYGNAVADGTVSSSTILLHYTFRCLTFRNKRKKFLDIECTNLLGSVFTR